MSRFQTRPSPAYMEAVAALKALPLNERDSALADASADDLKAAFATHLGKKAKGRKSWVRLIGRKPDANADEALPADDHTELWDNGSDLTYISHPYQVRLEEMREIVQTCDEHGLDCSVDAHSWYYPGGTVRVTWARRKEPRA